MKLPRKVTQKVFTALAILVLFSFSFFPIISFAAPAAGIVPTSCSGPDCGFNNLLELAKNVMDFLMTVSIPLAAIVFAYAGFLFMTAAGNEGQVSKAKEIFTKVLIGFIFVLCAWLIVWAITSALLCDPSQASCGFYDLLDRS